MSFTTWCISFYFVVLNILNVLIKANVLYSVQKDCTWTLVSQTILNSPITMYINEGLTFGDTGTNELYLTGQYLILKVNASNTHQVLDINHSPLPQFSNLAANVGADHIGDVAYNSDNKMIYAPIENTQFINASIYAYDTSTTNIPLNPIVYFTRQRHCPWLALNTDNSVLYSSEFSNVSVIYAYNASLMTKSNLNNQYLNSGSRSGDDFQRCVSSSKNGNKSGNGEYSKYKYNANNDENGRDEIRCEYSLKENSSYYDLQNVSIPFYDIKLKHGGNNDVVILESVQGGAVYEKDGFLYLTQNPPQPAVVAVNIDTGEVTTVVNDTIPREAEGIAFYDLTAQGKGKMHVMNGHDITTAFGKFTTIFHYDCL